MLVFELVVVLVLVLVNGILAGSELAIVSSRKERLESMAAEGRRGARVALKLVADPGSFLATVQIGITLVGIVAGAYSGATFAAGFGEWLNGFAWIAPNGPTIAIALIVVVVTYISLIVGELVPKRIALTNPERVATIVAPPMLALSRIAAPAVWLLRFSSDAVLRVFGLGGARNTVASEEEIKALIAEGTRAGVFEPQERKMIEGVLRLADRSVRAIMTPRADVAWIAADADGDEVLRRLRDNRHTRLLVCDGSIDRPVGLIAASDVIGLAAGSVRLADAAGKVPVVPEQARVLDLIEVFRREGVHFAVIVDEYGSTQGIATATDILESIAGDLPDIGESASPMVKERSDGSWLVDGLLPIDEFESLVGLRGLRGGDFETVAGFFIDRFGHLPATGDSLAVDGLRIEVVDMDGLRIDQLLVSRLPQEADGGDG